MKRKSPSYAMILSPKGHVPQSMLVPPRCPHELHLRPRLLPPASLQSPDRTVQLLLLACVSHAWPPPVRPASACCDTRQDDPAGGLESHPSAFPSSSYRDVPAVTTPGLPSSLESHAGPSGGHGSGAWLAACGYPSPPHLAWVRGD